jgi:hypothetical protein
MKTKTLRNSNRNKKHVSRFTTRDSPPRRAPRLYSSRREARTCTGKPGVTDKMRMGIYFRREFTYHVPCPGIALGGDLRASPPGHDLNSCHELPD